MENKKNNDLWWFDNPNFVTNIIIGLIIIIIILSQSFAINNNLSTNMIFRSIINHNIIYLISLVYFVLLKTHIGKKYFNFLNVFLALLYLVTSITALLTVFQSFSLTSLVNLAMHLVILIYIVHTFFRNTRVWGDFNLEKSPFSEINNDTYLYIIVVLSVILLAINLIFTTSVDGTFLSILDTVYIIFFARYIYLYGVFLEKKYNINTSKDIISDIVDDISDKASLAIDEIKDKTKEVLDDVKNNTSRNNEGVKNKKKSTKKGSK